MKHRYAFPVAIVAAGLFLAAGAGAAVLDYEATIDGSQEVPAVATAASGSATISIDTVANTLTYTITFSGLSAAETVAHIHGFADPGVSAGALHPLPAGSPKNGVWIYSEGQEADILAGRTYINIHSSNYPGGEIRGQIVESSTVPTEVLTWGQIKQLFP